MATNKSEWRNPSPAPSDGDSENLSSSSDESSDDGSSSSYESVQLTPRPQKKKWDEEEEDPTYTPRTEGHSSKGSHTPGRQQADEEGHVSKRERQHQQILMTHLSLK
jgi:hypothetical protein